MSTFTGVYANDTFNAGAGGDIGSGGGGADRLIGGAGADTLYGFGAQDTQANSGAVQAHLLPHVNNPVGMVAAPGDAHDLYIVGMTGQVQVLDTSTDQMRATPFLDIPSSDLGSGGERGLEALVFDPDYASNGEVYVSVATPNGDFQVWRYSRSASDPSVADPASRTLILSAPHPNDAHYAGWMTFGPDGYLYIGTGDNDVGPNPGNPAGDLSSLLGKVLRIDVHRDDFPSDPSRNYGIPADNPYADVAGAAPEVFASGLRNPWRASFDASGNLYVADVGENAQEELNLIPAGSGGGQNFGWPAQEGDLGPGGPGLTAPILTYDHGAGLAQGDCIIGGYVYQGPGGADGLYVYGDFSTPNLWAADIQNGQVLSIVNLNSSLQVDAGQLTLLTSFGVDSQGQLYASTVYGELYRLSFTAAAGDGSDVISGGGGNDALYGGAGEDQLYGGNGVDTLNGGLGADVLDGGGQADLLTGGAGADRFVVSFLPDAAAIISDFTLGQDRLDLNALLAQYGYAGHDPVADGWVTVAADGADGSNVYFDPDGPGARAGVLVADLQHVAPSSSNLANALSIYTPRAAASSGDAAYTVPDQVTDITLTGSGQTVAGNDAGDAFFSNGAGATIVGGGGQDLFHVGGGGDVLTGGAGADIFLFSQLPTVAARILDFTPGEDIIDLSGLLASAGYGGANPQADGYLQIQQDANGAAQIWARTDPAGGQAWTLVASLPGVAAANLAIDGPLVVASGDPPPGYVPASHGGVSLAQIAGPGALGAGASGATDFVFTVTRSGDLSAAAALDYYRTYGGTADSSDFAGPTAGTVRFQPGEATAAIHIAVAGDPSAAEPDETFTIALANPRGVAIGGSGSATATILASDGGAGGATIDIAGPGALHGGASGVTDFAFTLTRGGDVSAAAAVDYYRAYGGTADSSDFAGQTAGTVYFQAGQSSAVFHVAVAGDPAPEPDESFIIALANARGGTIGTGSATAVILSGDGPNASWSTAEPDAAAPADARTVTLTGTSSQTVHGNDSGDTFWSNNNGNTLIGGMRDDLFHLGRNGDVATGGGGNDTFAFAENPWSPNGRITDFKAGDVIDLTQTLQKAGYVSGDAVAEGYLKFSADSAGSAQVWFNPDPHGAGVFWLVTGLEGVNAANLHANAGLITV